MALRLRLRVGELMREKGISEAVLADKANVTRNTVRYMQRGATTRVDLPILDRIAEALGVRPMELFEEFVETERVGNRVPALVASFAA